MMGCSGRPDSGAARFYRVAIAGAAFAEFR